MLAVLQIPRKFSVMLSSQALTETDHPHQITKRATSKKGSSNPFGTNLQMVLIRQMTASKGTNLRRNEGNVKRRCIINGKSLEMPLCITDRGKLMEHGVSRGYE